MKKMEYITPELEIVEIETQSMMLFGSDETPRQNDPDKPNPDGGDDKWAD